MDNLTDDLIDYMIERASYGSEVYKALIDQVDDGEVPLSHDQYNMITRDFMEDRTGAPDLPDSSRRVICGSVISLEERYNEYGLYVWAALLLANDFVVYLRVPKQETWLVGDVVQVVVNIEVSRSDFRSGVGRNPRRVVPGKTKEAIAKQHKHLMDKELYALLNADSS